MLHPEWVMEMAFELEELTFHIKAHLALQVDNGPTAPLCLLPESVVGVYCHGMVDAQ